MDSQLMNLMCEVELQPGEKLTIPNALAEQVGAGRSRIRIEATSDSSNEIRRHDAFLNGYAPEDDGLYDASRADANRGDFTQSQA